MKNFINFSALSILCLVSTIAKADVWTEKTLDQGHLANHLDTDATYANLTGSGVWYLRVAGSHSIYNDVSGEPTISPTAPDSWWGFLQTYGHTVSGTVSWSSVLKTIPSKTIYTFGHTYTMREGVSQTWTKTVVSPYSTTDYTRSGSGLVGNIDEYETWDDVAPGTGGGG